MTEVSRTPDRMTMTRTGQTLSLPPIDCTPWCTEGTGHTDAGHPDDQWCSSISFPVSLSLEEPILWSDDTTRPADTKVYASKDPGEPALVTLVDREDRGTRYTPAEARELARVLMHAAWVAEQTA